MGLRGLEFAADIGQSFPRVHSRFSVFLEGLIALRKDAFSFRVDLICFTGAAWCFHIPILAHSRPSLNLLARRPDFY
jgi:hypothetical protein